MVKNFALEMDFLLAATPIHKNLAKSFSQNIDQHALQ
jgi:hypothetical protein